MLTEEGGAAFPGRNLAESKDTELAGRPALDLIASFVAVGAAPGCKLQGKGNRCLVRSLP